MPYWQSGGEAFARNMTWTMSKISLQTKFYLTDISEAHCGLSSSEFGLFYIKKFDAKAIKMDQIPQSISILSDHNLFSKYDSPRDHQRATLPVLKVTKHLKFRRHKQ